MPIPGWRASSSTALAVVLDDLMRGEFDVIRLPLGLHAEIAEAPAPAE
ncbi:hypothetical protein [Streptomyces sp. SR-10]